MVFSLLRLANQTTPPMRIPTTLWGTGMSVALIGNTAEVVLDALESDVLVLKPQEVEDHLVELAVKH